MSELKFERTGGKYKLELFFGPDKSNKYSFRGIVTVWQSHSDRDGDSDVLISLCPKCKAPILEDSYGLFPPKHPDEEPFQGAACGECGNTWRIGQVIQYVGAIFDVDAWSDLVLKYYKYLKGDMDIYMKRFYGNISKETKLQMAGRSGDVVDNRIATGLPYELSIYSLPRLIEDTSQGADLKTAIKGFLSA